MKKFLFLSLFMMAALFGMSQNDNALVGRARGALNNCLRGNNYDVNVAVTGSCFAGGFLTTVTFAEFIPCPPIEDRCYEEGGEIFCYPCDPVYIVVGSVTFGCEGEIIDVQCNN